MIFQRNTKKKEKQEDDMSSPLDDFSLQMAQSQIPKTLAPDSVPNKKPNAQGGQPSSNTTGVDFTNIDPTLGRQDIAPKDSVDYSDVFKRPVQSNQSVRGQVQTGGQTQQGISDSVRGNNTSSPIGAVGEASDSAR